MPTKRELEQIEEEISEIKKQYKCDSKDIPPKSGSGGCGSSIIIIWNDDHTRKLVLRVNLDYSSALSATDIRYSATPFEKEWITCMLRTLEFVKCVEIEDVLDTFRRMIKDFKDIENDTDEEQFLTKYEFHRLR